MGMPRLQMLQAPATAVISKVFELYPDLRDFIFEELHEVVISRRPTGKHAERSFLLPDEDVFIQTSTAVAMQCLQAGVQLPRVGPPDGAGPQALKEGFDALNRPVMAWADLFWRPIIAALPKAKTVKADTEFDWRAVCSETLADLFKAFSLPEWPAAATLLQRFTTLLHSNHCLHHPDNAVRQISVDLLAAVIV